MLYSFDAFFFPKIINRGENSCTNNLSKVRFYDTDYIVNLKDYIIEILGLTNNRTINSA